MTSSDSRTDRDHDDVTEMRWWEEIPSQLASYAHEVTHWVTKAGGEARYEVCTNKRHDHYPSPRIAVRQADGSWAYAAPGDTIIKGETWFYVWDESVPMIHCRRREFTVRRSS